MNAHRELRKRHRVSCKGKTRYPSEAQARKHLREKPDNLEVYRCYCCGMWHLGRRSGWRLQTIIEQMREDEA